MPFAKVGNSKIPAPAGPLAADAFAILLFSAVTLSTILLHRNGGFHRHATNPVRGVCVFGRLVTHYVFLDAPQPRLVIILLLFL